MSDPTERLADMIEEDVRRFADKRTPVATDVVGASIRVGWRQRRSQRNEVFGLDTDDRLMWLREGDIAVPYRAFLESDDMADLQGLAEATTLKYEPLDAFVPPSATLEGSDGIEVVTASLNEMSALIRARLFARVGVTTVFFLKGDAGAGKTTLLQQLVADQAQRYSDGSRDAGFLFLYVSAQGRLLSNLPDALAAETQDLSAHFRNDAVPVLARRRLLVPIIDGFDELLGTAGYSDAFSSLQALLRDLDGHGVVVVSARSSFYESEFVRRGALFDESSYDVIPVSLHPWNDDELKTYVRLASPAKRATAYIDLLRDIDSGDIELLRRPFFGSAYPLYAEQRLSAGHAPAILDHLIAAYVAREAEKIVDASGAPLLDPDGHRRIFEEAAEQMWTAGDRMLRTDDLRAVAALVAEEADLAPADVAQFENKITSYAGFTLAESRDAFAFEHEVYFDFFLAQAGSRALETGDFASFLDQGLLPSRVLAGIASSTSREILFDRLSGLPASDTKVNRRMNAAGLVAAIGRRNGVVNERRLRHMDFVGTDLGGLEFRNCVFESCTFFEALLDGTIFDRCNAIDTTFAAVHLDGMTRFDIAGVNPNVHVSSLIDAETETEMFDPSTVSHRLTALGLPQPSEGREDVPALGPRASEAVELIEQLHRRFRRTTTIAEDDRDGHSRIFSHAEWPVLKALLIEHEMIRLRTRPASGRRKEFMRPSVDFRDVLAGERRSRRGEPDSFSAFWADVWRLDS